MTVEDLGPAFDSVARSVYTWIFLGVVVLLYELRTVLDRNPHTLPLTTVVVSWVPGGITMAFLTWAWIHFFVRYLNSGYWWFK
jgi:hypothetical protein